MEFSMEIIDAKAIEDEVFGEVKAVPEEINNLKKQAEENALKILNFDLDSFDEKKSILSSMEKFGLDSMQKSAQKNSLLKTSIGKLSQAGSEGGEVSKSLVDLHREIKNLDPSLVDFTKTGILGKIFNPIRSYFEKYEKVEDVIANIIVSLDKGKTTLKNDNTTLALEEQAIRELTKKIDKEILLGGMMDEYISIRLEEIHAEGADEDKIRFIQEEVIFPLRQRMMDMQQLVVVNHQAIIAMEVVQRNNKKLMRGVDRAKTVTVSALRTAVMVASALYNQRIVLNKIQILNDITNNLISSTSKMLKDQGSEIQKKSMETSMDIEVLKISFNDALASLEAISAYKQEALPIMKEKIEQFRELAEKGESEIAKLEKGSTMLK